MNDEATHWLALVISLPTQNATLRMRLWRALKSLGCAALRDGVYLLPERAGGEKALLELADSAMGAGGLAHLLRFPSRDEGQEKAFRGLFDRGTDYADLIERMVRFRESMQEAQHSSIARGVQEFRKDFNAIARVDFFPGGAKGQAETQLVQAEAEAASMVVIAPDEPRAIAARIPQVDRDAYRGRLWATRANLWVDRLASAWLIRRFVDSEARFVWLERVEDCPADAVGFDFNGAEFSHVGSFVTFETLAASFGLGADTGLARLGGLVHYLDVGGAPVAEAPGLEMILKGIRNRCSGDDEFLAGASPTFDSLYAAYGHAAEQGL